MERLIQLLLLAAVLAAPATWVWRRPVPASIGILTYLAFEEFVLRFLPAHLYAPARIGPEALLYLAATSAVVRAARQPTGPRARIVWPEAALVLLAGYGAVLGLARGVDPVFIGIGVRWLFRYLPLYLLWRVAGDAKGRAMLAQAIVALVVIQSAIGIGQAVLQSAGVPVLTWMQAPVGGLEVGGIELVTGGTRQQLGSPFRVFGTLGRYHRFGIFVAAGTVVALLAVLYRVRDDSWVRAAVGACLLALVLSTSRQAFLLLTVGLGVVAVGRLGLSSTAARTIRGLGVLGAGFGVLILGSGALATWGGGTGLLARWSTLETVGFRAYYLLMIVPRVLVESAYLGLGAGTFASRPHVTAFPEQYLAWGFPGEWTLEYSYDSEWAILLGQYGVAGPILCYGALVGLGWYAARLVRDPGVAGWDRVLAATALCFAVAFPLLGAIGAELGSRTTAYLVWGVFGAVMSLVSSPESRRATLAPAEGVVTP